MEYFHLCDVKKIINFKKVNSFDQIPLVVDKEMPGWQPSDQGYSGQQCLALHSTFDPLKNKK
jgi:hypothetical protein